MTVVVLLAGWQSVFASPPASYYASAEGKQGAELRQALHLIIRNHWVIAYSSSSRLDTRDALEVLDEQPGNPDNVWLLYAQRAEPKTSFGLSTGWNREHLWCNSYGLDDVEPAYSDLHNLRAEDANVNSARGNKLYDISTMLDGNYSKPAHLEAPLCSADADSWEPPDVVKGDIARALFYMMVRYTGDAANEPALMLTDKLSLIQSSNSYMGRFSTLLSWHLADPVSAAEEQRNELIYSLYQTNRNPFVDHPGWVSQAFLPRLSIASGATNLVLSWPADAPTMILEQSDTASGNWVALTNSPTEVSNTWVVALPHPAGNRFFRLRLP